MIIQKQIPDLILYPKEHDKRDELKITVRSGEVIFQVDIDGCGNVFTISKKTLMQLIR